MFLSQEINVNLTPENVAILNRPSRFFNKLKASIAGGMTPTEVRQAEVMLSVLQRINRSFRAKGISNLVKIDINKQNVFKDEQHEDTNDLERGQRTVFEALQGGQFKAISQIDMVLENASDFLHYIIDVKLLRNPETDEAPVKITVVAVLKELERLPGESNESLVHRMKQYAEERLQDSESVARLKQCAEEEFEVVIRELNSEITKHFPAGSNRSPLRVRTASRRGNYSATRHSDTELDYDLDFEDHFFSSSLAYLPFWGFVLNSVGSSEQSLADELGWEPEQRDLGSIIPDYSPEPEPEPERVNTYDLSPPASVWGGASYSSGESSSSDSGASCSSSASSCSSSSCSSCGGD